MSYFLKQSSTAKPLLFFLTSSVDGVTPLTGASPTVTLSKNGAAFGSPSGAVSEVANGWYKVAGNATDTATLGPLVLHATGTGADPADYIYTVVAYDPDVTFTGTGGVLLANGAHGGAAATLALKSASVDNSGGTTAGVTIAGGGSGDGLKITGGSSGSGLNVVGNGTGSGIIASADGTAPGIAINAGSNANGISVFQSGSGFGFGGSLSSTEHQTALRRIYGIYGTVWCVSTNGNDSNDGLSWETAFVTPSHALSVATTGDLIVLSAGIFDLGSGGLAFNPNTGISMVGAGIDRTIITSTGVINGGHLGAIISLGSNALYSNFTVQGSLTAEVYAAPLGVDSAAAFPFAVTNTTVRRVKTLGWSDGLYFRGTGTNSMRFEECQFVSNYDCVNIFGGGTYTVDFLDCNFQMQQTAGATQGSNNDSRGIFFNRPGTLRVIGGSIYMQSDEPSAVVNALKLGNTAGAVNCQISGVNIATRSSGAGGVAWDLFVRNTGNTTVSGLSPKRSKVSLNDTHTVTYCPGSVLLDDDALTAIDTAASIIPADILKVVQAGTIK